MDARYRENHQVAEGEGLHAGEADAVVNGTAARELLPMKVIQAITGPITVGSRIWSKE